MNPNRKTVYQYTLDGEFVSEYPSLVAAAKKMNGSPSTIGLCCKGKIKSAFGFLWSNTQSPDYISTIVSNVNLIENDTIDGEIWADVKGYEGLYQVSNLGRVKGVKRDSRNRGKVLKQQKTKQGYYLIMLYKDKKGKYISVHRLVAMAFIPNPYNKPCVDHIDANPSNNKVDNLRWVTYKENANNPISLSRNKVRGTKGYMYGRKHTKESLEKMSRVQKGHPTSEETRKKISDAKRGKKYGEEYCKRMSERRKRYFETHKGVGSIKLAQYTKDGSLVKIWDNITAAAKFYNVSYGSIRNSTKGMKHYATEFVWKIVE